MSPLPELICSISLTQGSGFASARLTLANFLRTYGARANVFFYRYVWNRNQEIQIFGSLSEMPTSLVANAFKPL